MYVRGFARVVVRAQLFPLIEDFSVGAEVDFEMPFFQMTWNRSNDTKRV